jgi:hypothetical protein
MSLIEASAIISRWLCDVTASGRSIGEACSDLRPAPS